ncbi:MAG: TetR family transcriptional regulator [Clostridiaceae bacterium BRH_c20a]|nr:MAG: TetR family transcriptional regulator [Clostridiaceae bacterium BRH_c20a]
MDIVVMDTNEKILEATIEIIKKKGLKAATTRAIAVNAGVNEVTIFRNFGSKKGIIKALIEKCSYAPAFSKVLKERVVWDLEKDLYMLAKQYHQIANKNHDLIVIMISLMGTGHFPELQREIVNIPRQLKGDLHDYFTIMREKGKIIDTNIEAQVMNFIGANFGLFFTRSLFGTQLTELTEEEFLQNSIQVFVRGLQP